MSGTIGNHSTENNLEVFRRQIRKNFKARMNMEIALCQRERKAIGADMGISQATLSDWLSEGKIESMPAHMLPAWTREVGRGLLSWVARENGLDLVDREDSAPEVTDAGQLLGLISIHHGKVMALILQARIDGVIDDAERQAIWTEIQRLLREIEMEAEHFRPRSLGEAVNL